MIKSGRSTINKTVVEGHLNRETTGVTKDALTYLVKVKQTKRGQELQFSNLKFKDKIVDFLKRSLGLQTDRNKISKYVSQNSEIRDKIIGALNRQEQKETDNKLILKLSNKYFENVDDGREDRFRDDSSRDQPPEYLQSWNQYEYEPESYHSIDPYKAIPYDRGSYNESTGPDTYIPHNAHTANQPSAYGLSSWDDPAVGGEVKALFEIISEKQHEYNPSDKINIQNRKRDKEYQQHIAPTQSNFPEQNIAASRHGLDIHDDGKWETFLFSKKMNGYSKTDKIHNIDVPLPHPKTDTNVLLFGDKFIGDGVLGRGNLRDSGKKPAAEYCVKYPPVLKVIQDQIDSGVKPLNDTEILEIQAGESDWAKGSLCFMPARSIINSDEKHFTSQEISNLFRGMLTACAAVRFTSHKLHTGFLNETVHGKDPVVMQKLLRVAANICDLELVFHGEKAEYDRGEKELESLGRRLPDASFKQILEEIYQQQLT